MLNNGCLQHGVFRRVEERSQARSRNLGGAVPTVDAVNEDLLAPADRLEVARGNASGTRPR